MEVRWLQPAVVEAGKWGRPLESGFSILEVIHKMPDRIEPNPLKVMWTNHFISLFKLIPVFFFFLLFPPRLESSFNMIVRGKKGFIRCLPYTDARQAPSGGNLWRSLLLFSCSVVSDSLRPHGLQHARPPCPSPSPRVCSNSCPLSWWCHPTISSSVALFSYLQSFPASGSFPMSWLFTSCDHSRRTKGWIHIGQKKPWGGRNIVEVARAQWALIGACAFSLQKLWKGIKAGQWHPTPVLLPGKSHGRRSLVGCSPWGC